MRRADRVAGSLFGLAFGDALGKPTEFLRVDEIVARYGAGGPRELSGDPALVTDDTQMALAVGWALREAEAWNAAALEPALRRRFVAWAMSPDNNRAPGRTCLDAVGRLAEGVSWQESGVPDSKGCGANMRVTPVGLVPGVTLADLSGAAQLQAALTHGHPTALAASDLTAYAVRVLCDGVEPGDLPRLLRERCAEQRGVYRADWLADLWEYGRDGSATRYIARGWDECAAVLDRLDAALSTQDDGGDACLATGAGWIAEEALATALLCALRHRNEPVAALARAATTSGDSDSIACLAGAFVGAAHGMAAWPEGWAARIEYAEQLSALAAAWE